MYKTVDPCSDHFVRESNYTRTVDYTLNWWEYEECETRNITPGWYRKYHTVGIVSISNKNNSRNRNKIGIPTHIKAFKLSNILRVETVDPCSDHFVRESNYTRTVDYTLNLWESGECETRNITPGWYRYNNSLNIPTINTTQLE
jgi:hypothetical protein